MPGRGRAAASARADEQLRQVRLRELARTDPQDERRDGDEHATPAVPGPASRIGRPADAFVPSVGGPTPTEHCENPHHRILISRAWPRGP